MSYSRSSEYHKNEQLIATYGKLIAHPARLRILQQLTTTPLTLLQLQEDHPLPRPTLMKHLNQLILHHLVAVESSVAPATYTTTKNQWPSFISHAVRLANRFNYANAA